MNELVTTQENKRPLTEANKFYCVKLTPQNPDSLVAWAGIYFQTNVLAGSKNTEKAKQSDLSLFLNFFQKSFAHDHVDDWTPDLTKHFQQELRKAKSEKTKRPFKATTINRRLATISKFGKWLHKQRPLLAGAPTEGIKEITVEEPAWMALSDAVIMSLKSACEQRLFACKRADQNPELEAAVLHILLATGLREFELVSLNKSQYHSRSFHQVRRKGKKVTRKVPIPSQARKVSI